MRERNREREKVSERKRARVEEIIPWKIWNIHMLPSLEWYGVATMSRLLKIIGLFCKRALQKRLYSAKETYNFKEPTNHSHPIRESERNIYIYIYFNCSSELSETSVAQGKRVHNVENMEYISAASLRVVAHTHTHNTQRAVSWRHICTPNISPLSRSLSLSHSLSLVRGEKAKQLD